MRLKLVILVGILLIVLACQTERRGGARAPRMPKDNDVIVVTGYCNCGECCGWERSWLGLGPAVYNYGKMKGKRKEVGVTATGTKAKSGTIAADPRIFKFGTKMTIPGYGQGKVEDIGGAIKGYHIDLWFPSHREARKWGVKRFKLSELNVRR